MTKADIIDNLYKSPDINEAINKMEPASLRDDLKQEMFMVLLEMEESRLTEMFDKGYLKFFLVRTMLNMIKSDRSAFFKNFRNFFELPDAECGAIIRQVVQDDILEEYKVAGSFTSSDKYEEQQIDIDKAFGTCRAGLYERDMFMLYAYTFNCNASELSKNVGINYKTVTRTIQAARLKIKNYLKCLPQ